jgi:hypothetical protein
LAAALVRVRRAECQRSKLLRSDATHALVWPEVPAALGPALVLAPRVLLPAAPLSPALEPVPVQPLPALPA